ncbi:MAG: FHA domain-containing protein, partial [Chloroflexota bacterium]
MADTYQLVIQKGPNPGRVVELLDDEVTMGREATNSLPFDERSLSRTHARLVRTSSGYTLQDLGSTNGTYVNGVIVTGLYPMKHGDIVSLGDAVTLEYRKIAVSTNANATFVMPAPDKKTDATAVLPSRAALQAELDKAGAKHADEHRALFIRWFSELWNKKNYAITRELVAPEFTAHGAGGQDIKQGPDGVAGMVKIWHDAFPDGHMTMDDIITEGEYSTIR